MTAAAQDLIMVPGFGALPKVPPTDAPSRYIAANDNVAGRGKPDGDTEWVLRSVGYDDVKVAVVKAFRDAGVILTPEDEAALISDIATTTFAPLEQLAAREAVPVAPPRKGEFMQTFTGRQFWPMDPRADEVHIEDIAHALSLQCRYAGHCLRFYSVAEHSIHIAWWLYRNVGPVSALQGLLHDASEAYLVDVPRPVKPHLAGYKDAEAKVQAVIMRRFGLPVTHNTAVKEADDRIIGDELVNLRPMDWHARHNEPLGVTLAYWSPRDAELKFLAAFKALSEEVRGSQI